MLSRKLHIGAREKSEIRRIETESQLSGKEEKLEKHISSVSCENESVHDAAIFRPENIINKLKA
jgi:protein-arginine kinase activator protein McsA